VRRSPYVGGTHIGKANNNIQLFESWRHIERKVYIIGDLIHELRHHHNDLNYPEMPDIEDELDSYRFEEKFLSENISGLGTILGADIENIKIQFNQEGMLNFYKQFFGRGKVEE
jgi:hypothetical protein